MCLCFSGLVFDLAGLGSSSTTTRWFTWHAVLRLQTRNLANHCHMYIWKLGESLFRCAASTRSPRRRRGAVPPRGRCRNPRRPKTGFFHGEKKLLFLPSVAHVFWSLLDIWHTFQSPFWLQARPERVPQRTKRVATVQWPENGCSVLV